MGAAAEKADQAGLGPNDTGGTGTAINREDDQVAIPFTPENDRMARDS